MDRSSYDVFDGWSYGNTHQNAQSVITSSKLYKNVNMYMYVHVYGVGRKNVSYLSQTHEYIDGMFVDGYCIFKL